MSEGLVHELQRACLDTTVPTAEIMRRAYVVARKLGLKEFEEWITKEIYGYDSGDQTPDYRYVSGDVKVWNPYRGWIPVRLSDVKAQELISRRPAMQPVGELETVLSKSKGTGLLMMSFTPQQERDILGADRLFANPKLHISLGVLQGIVDRVRNLVLKWCLDLEEQGVKGEGMTFSEQEKKAAKSVQKIEVHYHGTVSQSQIATTSSSQTLTTTIDADEMKLFVKVLRENIEKLQATAEEERQVLADLASIEAQLSAPKPSFGIISEAYRSVRNIAEGMIGSLLASGLLTKLPM